ncbi:uncharacterized protein [Leptinotarsa decemlineata]|uniref:uncharacterized protein n=1 Tax=Leptinotarsa decemlineata TaxID=7539 RepID=UPI003D3095AD
MPRIDPLKLLGCLSILLTPEGGILSRDEVVRLVNLMTKFSKKLVSKCVYVLILKSTEIELVDMFMAEGGWALIQTWLQEAVQTGNWDLVKEILGLLLITPVDVERLKLNILPKLIKSLSRRGELEGVAELSTKLVQHWLVIVKGSNNPSPKQAVVASDVIEISNADTTVVDMKPVSEEEKGVELETVSTETFYKPADKEVRLNNRKLSEEEPEAAAEEPLKTEEEKSKSSSKGSKNSSSSKSGSSKDKEKSKDRNRDKSQDKGKDRDDRNRDKDRKSKSSSSSKHRSSSSTDEKDRERSSKDKSGREKDRDKDRSDRDKRKSNSSSKSSGSSSREKSKDSKDKVKDKDSGKDKPVEKENQAEKDKDTLEIIKPPTIDKLGRIPKKPSVVAAAAAAEEELRESKKKAFSIGVRKDREERPKTVKIFNSKMRSTGLEEEVKPAPARAVKKPTPSLQLPTIPMKRPSPPRDIKDPIIPPEKKLRMDKVDIPDRPGAIKLIPPKPKPVLLQESDLFMDAITAATTKKEPKKRKRRPSVTKDASPQSPSSSPSREQPQTPTSPTQTGANTSPLGLKNIAPINFYQDTLTEVKEEEKPDVVENGVSKNAEEKMETDAQDNVKEELSGGSPPATPTDEIPEEAELGTKRTNTDGELKGVLLHTKKTGPKRSISWKSEADLVEIRYFELDETERVNVTKTFGDMAKMDISSEREALQLSRKLGGEDTMEPQIMWRIPFIIDQDDPLAVPGNKSLEKDIQFAREKNVLQALYFDKRRIPNSPEEPIPENHQMSDPIHIPLEDPESQDIDLRSTPWPEPKGMAPEPVMQPVLMNIQGPFNPQFNSMPPPSFQGMPPRFAGPGGPMGPGIPNNFVPPNVMPGGNMMGPGPNHPNMGRSTT